MGDQEMQAEQLAEHGQDRVTLREFVALQISELRAYIDVRLVSIEDATVLARTTINTRLDAMNEFRGALKDVQNRYVTREEFAAIVQRFRVDIDDLKKYRATMEGKASQSSVNTVLFFSVAGLALAAVSIALSLLGG